LQQTVLAGLLGPGGAPAQLPDLHFAERDGKVALSPENLAPGVDVGALRGAVRLTDPAGARRAADAAAATAGGYLEFRPPLVEGDRLTLGLAVHAFPPGGAEAVPISTLSLHYRRQGDSWVPAGPPAALSA
jgi:hypothetical protein